MILWVQEWEESERNWGVRPDGFTVHHKREDVEAFLLAMRRTEFDRFHGAIPETYSRPTGEPFRLDIDPRYAPPPESIGVWFPATVPLSKAKVS